MQRVENMNIYIIFVFIKRYFVKIFSLHS